MKIVALDAYTLDGDDWSAVAASGELVKYDRTPPETVIERAAGAAALLVNKVKIGETELAKLPELRYIGVLATGYDVIDLAAARRYGVAVTNIPAYGTQAVAQLTFAHILHLSNRLADHAASVAAGDWCRSPDFSYRLTPQTGLYGKTLGIIGCGRIGSAVARIGQAFGMTVVGTSRHPLPPASGIRQLELDELLQSSDIVSLHCPATPETRKMINAVTLGRMKPGSFLINTSRGALIDEAALAEALNSGRLAGAGLDVLDGEPPSPGNVLLAAKNCFITPHLAWSGDEARGALLRIAGENLRAFAEARNLNRVD
ncbi:MAG: D-2-hydroxyacid dehydrogenase [Victivallaceae bacterium]